MTSPFGSARVLEPVIHPIEEDRDDLERKQRLQQGLERPEEAGLEHLEADQRTRRELSGERPDDRVGGGQDRTLVVAARGAADGGKCAGRPCEGSDEQFLRQRSLLRR